MVLSGGMHVWRSDPGSAEASVDDLGAGPVSTGLGAWPAKGPVGVQMAGGELVEVLGELHLPTQDVTFTGGTLLADADDRLQQFSDPTGKSDLKDLP